jgi:ParB family chromosome partitioning protein
MSEDGKILNRGLDALLGSSKSTNQRTIKDVEVSSINAGRFQPRANFDEEKLLELTDSIKNHGVLSPILVRELGLNKYEVIAGERRLRATKQGRPKNNTVSWLTKKKIKTLSNQH